LKDFIIYFFGEGDTEEFHNFTLAHFAPIIIAAIIIFLIYRFRDKIRESKCDKVFRYTMAFMLIISELSYFWRLVGVPSLGANPVDHLPITVCGWVVVFCSFMVIGKSQTLFDISYFWLFSGSIFALLTPTVITYTGITRFRYYQFWVEHTFGYISIFYMIFVHKMRPNVKSIFKSYVALFILAAVAYSANSMLGPGANYLFLAKPEDTPSVLDILPPNFALRLFIMFAVVTLMFALAYLPWFIKDRKAKKQINKK
jgi:hypothetical integral membrane protein (TIGR02206 family)